MDSLRTVVDDFLRENPDRDTFSIEHEGRLYWVKKGRKTGSNILQKAAYSVSRNPLLIPVAHKNRLQTLRYETAKLRRLKTELLSVPELAYSTDNYFVMHDCGTSVYFGLKKQKFGNPDSLIDRSLEQLCKLHNMGEFHGGSQLKNFTADKDGNIYMLDFEESFDDNADMELIRFRDLFLFLFSLAKTEHKTDFVRLVHIYISSTGNKYTLERLKKLRSSLSIPMKILGSRIVWKIADSDSRSVYRLLLSLGGL